MDLSADGVPEAKSGHGKFVVISVAFPFCGLPYPICILNPKDSRDRPTTQELYASVIAQMQELNMRINKLVFDAVERKRALGLAGCTATYGCDVCEIKGDRTISHNATCYPFKHNNEDGSCPDILRTTENIRDLAPQSCVNIRFRDAGGKPKTLVGLYGVKDKSPFLDVADFDMVAATAIDPMHNLDLGITLRLFEVGHLKASITHSLTPRVSYLRSLSERT